MEDVRTVLINRVSWSAVFAGVAISLVAQLILNMLGVAVGAGTVDPTSAAANPSPSGFTIGAGFWWAVSGIIAAALGGYTAGRLSGRPEPSTAAWHGLTSWAFTTLALVYLATTTFGAVMGGVVSSVGTISGGIVQAGSQVAPAIAKAADPFSSIEQQARSNAGDQNAQRDLLVAALRDMLLGAQSQQSAARDRAAQALARMQSIPIERAREQIAGYEQQYRQSVDQAKQTATQAAETTRRAVTWSMLAGSIALLLGALAAWWAGRESAVSPTIASVAQRLRATRRA
jgi:hypothetical protein